MYSESSTVRARAPPTDTAPLGMGLEKGEHAGPGIGGGVDEIVVLAVEEAVRSAFVGDDGVLDTRLRQRPLEHDVLLGRDVLVRPRLKRQDRARHLGRSGDGAR